MKALLLIVSFFLCLSCMTSNKSEVKDSPCDSFTKSIPSEYLKPHDGICLIRGDYGKAAPKSIHDIKVVRPIIIDGKTCAFGDSCPIFITFSWEPDADLGVVVEKKHFYNLTFSGEELEETLTYYRVKMGVNFRRKL